MTKAMPFLQKAILLSYDPRRFSAGFFAARKNKKILNRKQKFKIYVDKYFYICYILFTVSWC